MYQRYGRLYKKLKAASFKYVINPASASSQQQAAVSILRNPAFIPCFVLQPGPAIREELSYTCGCLSSRVPPVFSCEYNAMFQLKKLPGGWGNPHTRCIHCRDVDLTTGKQIDVDSRHHLLPARIYGVVDVQQDHQHNQLHSRGLENYKLLT